MKRIITPEITRDVLRDLRAILMERTTQAPAEAEALEAQVAKLRREIGRLTEALASSDDQPDAIVQAISQRSTRLRQLEAQLATMEAAIGTVDLELRRLEKEATQRLQNLHDEFSRSPESAKSALAELVGNSKLRFVAVDGRYRIRGPLYLHNCFASPAGFEPGRRENTVQRFGIAGGSRIHCGFQSLPLRNVGPDGTFWGDIGVSGHAARAGRVALRSRLGRFDQVHAAHSTD